MSSLKQILKKNEWRTKKIKDKHFAIRVTIEDFPTERTFWYSGLTYCGFIKTNSNFDSIIYKQPKSIEKTLSAIFRHYKKNNLGNNIIIRVFPVNFYSVWEGESCRLQYHLESDINIYHQKDIEDLTFKQKINLL